MTADDETDGGSIDRLLADYLEARDAGTAPPAE
jgi:hypothetical protein